MFPENLPPRDSTCRAPKGCYECQVAPAQRFLFLGMTGDVPGLVPGVSIKVFRRCWRHRPCRARTVGNVKGMTDWMPLEPSRRELVGDR